jgi:hypothetical protein
VLLINRPSYILLVGYVLIWVSLYIDLCEFLMGDIHCMMLAVR